MSAPLGEPFVSQVRDAIGRHAIFAPGELVVVAVSGGADSLSLLHCLHSLRAVLSLRLHVAHVQHGLRGIESEQDAVFVTEHARSYGLPCTVVRIDVAFIRREQRLSTEAAARQGRYTALRELAVSLGGGCIVTGHTQDDQAETLLLHLLRGSGLDGLQGMRPRQGDLARPLLGQSRQAIDAYCREHGLVPRQDSTNHNRRFRRNAIRLDLLPVLEHYNPRVREALARCATLLARDADYLHGQAELAFDGMLLAQAPDLLLARDSFAALPDGLRHHVMRLAMVRVLGGTEQFTAEHFDAIDELAMSGKSGRCWQLPRGLRVDAAGNQLLITKRPPVVKEVKEAGLALPGVATYGPWRVEASEMVVEDPLALITVAQQRGAAALEAWCDLAIVRGDLSVRGRRPGDRFHPVGLRGTRKVQDLLVDRKVPREQRDLLPIVSDDEGILWVVGQGLDQRVEINTTTRRALWLRATLERPGTAL